MQREVGHRSSWIRTQREIDPRDIRKLQGCERGTTLRPMQMNSILQEIPEQNSPLQRCLVRLNHDQLPKEPFKHRSV